MKKLNYLALFTFAAMVLSSCGGLNKMQESAADVTYKVTPPVLAERGDKVDVKSTLNIQQNTLTKKPLLRPLLF